ncbi:uncharacterized protein LOC111347217 [Stylophora pistillata]|nr:uncharacterized protein LOC111347217 [Stylophora pistillata]
MILLVVNVKEMKKADDELFSLTEKKRLNDDGESQSKAGVGHHEEDFMEEEFDGDFWIKVNKKQNKGMSWNRAMDEVTAEKLIRKFKDNGKLDSEDPALLMLKRWPASKQYQENPEKLPGLEQLVNRLLEILLESELNSDNRYGMFRDVDDKAGKTLLHYAAELGFLCVTRTLLNKFPLLLTVETITLKKKRALLPVDMALIAENDEVAAYLIRMKWPDRALSLFSWNPGNMTNPQPSHVSLKSIIDNPKMKKTVVAVLDQMVIPHWPHLPKRKERYESEEEKEAIEGVWCTMTENPLNYQFCYHVLDADEGGRPPKINMSAEEQQAYNEYFNWRDKSCLHVIAKSYNMEALQHPVVRMLIETKWRSYGHWFLCLQAGLYVIFLLCLSYSLLYGSTKPDPTQYRGGADFLRGLCEVVTLSMVLFYIYEEVNQMRL